MAACNASVARTPAKSSPSGEWRMVQCAPESTVRRIVPARPTIQQTLSEGAEPAVSSTATLLFCGVQVAPPSLENAMRPAGPMRHRVFVPRAEMECQLREPAIKPREAATSLRVAFASGLAEGA